MAISVTNIASNLTAISWTGFASTSVSMTSTTGNYYVLVVFANTTSAPAPTGGGVPTWTLIKSVSGKVFVYGGMATSSGSGTIAIQSQGGATTMSYLLDEVSGVSTSGAVVQSVVSSTAGSNPSVTLAAIGTGNGVYMVGGST